MNAISLFIVLSLYYVVVTISIQQTLEEDKLFIVLGNEIFLVNLIENPITKELISVLPLKTNRIEEKNSTKQLPLSIKIETENYASSLKLSSVEAHKGDIYLHNGKQLVLFNETETIINNNDEYVKLGFIEHADELFDVMEKNKRSNILLLNTLNYANHKGRISPYTYYNSIMNYFTFKVLTIFCFLFL